MEESNLKSEIASEQSKLEGCEREVVVIRRALEEYTAGSPSTNHTSMSAQELKGLLDAKLQEISASKVLIGRMRRALGSQLYTTPTGGTSIEPSISPTENRLARSDAPLLTTPFFGPGAAVKDTHNVSSNTKQMLELTDRIERLSSRLVTSEKEKAVAVDQLKLGITLFFILMSTYYLLRSIS